MALFDEERPASACAEAPDDLELGLAEGEAIHVLLADRLRVRQEYLGHALFHHRAADGVAQHIRWTLRVEDSESVLLADRLLLLLGEVTEDLVVQRLPEFRD